MEYKLNSDSIFHIFRVVLLWSAHYERLQQQQPRKTVNQQNDTQQ